MFLAPQAIFLLFFGACGAQNALKTRFVLHFCTQNPQKNSSSDVYPPPGIYIPPSREPIYPLRGSTLYTPSRDRIYSLTLYTPYFSEKPYIPPAGGIGGIYIRE